MTAATPEVSIADTVRWLHDEGLVRLAGVAEQAPGIIAAYTVEVATGTVVAHPVAGSGGGSDVITVAADDLPHPVGTAKRLVIVGVTTSEALLVVDLAATLAMSINADYPEEAARSWVMQLMLNSEVTVTTNCTEVAIGSSPRLRQSFIPGSGALIVNVDDGRPPVTAITLNATGDGPDHLEFELDGTGEMYLGARFWALRHVMRIEDEAWSALAERLDSESGGPPVGSVADYSVRSQSSQRLSEGTR
ncbi:hypothetical protein ACLMAJ_16775 [Nocardia sp. KC 131]|uniref:hypothetical protein n=1 Tax=Nocardia arseniciresistens TaxID=3392119 RepID=UPI00398ECC76